MKKKSSWLKNWMRAVAVLAALLFGGAGMLKDVQAAKVFPDVQDPSAYYYNAVYWAVENGITHGRGNYFKPDSACTRAEAVAFIYNIAEDKTITGSNRFVDVSEDDWYYKAVLWASEAGVTSGMGTINGKQAFRPNLPCSRSMIVTFICNYAKNVAKNYTVSTGIILPFPDVPEGSWYAGAVRWAYENGVAHGKGNGKFSPDENCTRAQMVCFLYNYMHMEQPESPEPSVTPAIPEPPVTPEVPDSEGAIELPEVPIK